MTPQELPRTSPSRRQFLQSSIATATTLTAASQVQAHAGGSDRLRIGLVGCGGRGTGAAQNALAADSNVKLVAMADAFPDRVEKSLAQIQRDLGSKFAEKVDVP